MKSPGNEDRRAGEDQILSIINADLDTRNQQKTTLGKQTEWIENALLLESLVVIFRLQIPLSHTSRKSEDCDDRLKVFNCGQQIIGDTELDALEIESPQQFFEKTLPEKFDPAKASGINAVIQMSITGPKGGNWIVAIKDQKLDVKQGKADCPDITIETSDADYLDLINGRIGGVNAFMSGKLKFTGSMTVALKLLGTGLI